MCGVLNSVTEASPRANLSTTLRRIGSDRALKTESSVRGIYLTIKLSIYKTTHRSTTSVTTVQ